MKPLLSVLCLCLLATVAAGQVQYQFNDSPRPEADVIVVSSQLSMSGSEMWLTGRLFNRGLKPAHNVRITPNLYSKYGILLPANAIELQPPDIPPTSFADFSGRVALYSDAEIVARPTAEWHR